MKMIGYLICCADMLKNLCSYITLRAIAPEHAPSDITAQNNDKEEDEDDVKACNCSMGKRNKRSGNKRDSDEVEKFRNTHEFMESDTEEN